MFEFGVQGGHLKGLTQAGETQRVGLPAKVLAAFVSLRHFFEPWVNPGLVVSKFNRVCVRSDYISSR